jgi:hypothetical protein
MLSLIKYKIKIKNMVKIFTKEDIEILKSLTIKNSNDQSLGQSVRSLYRGNEFVSDYPNDFDLGSEIRKLTKNK